MPDSAVLYKQIRTHLGNPGSTLVHWVSRLAWWLKPLQTLLASTIVAAPKIFCDDTPLPVLDRTRRRTRIARLWSYAMDDRPWNGPAPPAVVYLYAEDRKGRHVDEHLTGFSGVLQADAYAGYHRLTGRGRAGGQVTLAFCLAHARRKFFEIHKATGCAISAEALQRFPAIYTIEARIRGTSAEARLAVRQAETRPMFDALKPWLMDRLAEASAKSALAKAIRYTLGHWSGLGVFLTDGRVEVTPKPNCGTSSAVSRTTQSIALPSCCPGTSTRQTIQLPERSSSNPAVSAGRSDVRFQDADRKFPSARTVDV
jgi:hypothetical protein